MSLRLKTILGVAFIEAILLALLISMTLNYLESTNYDGLYKRATTTATLFSTTTKDAVISYDLASLEDFSSELMANPDIVYVKVLTPEGQVFTQAGDERLLTRAFIEDEDVSAVNDGVFDISASIEEGGQVFGKIELGIDTTGLSQSIEEARIWSASIAIGEMLLVALFSFLLGTYLTSRLSRLTEAANQISHGSTEFSLSTKGNDEISDVAEAFNQMSRRLTQAAEQRAVYEQQLEQLNQTLESRVERRTEQLKSNIYKLEGTNKKLQVAQEQLIQSEKMASIGTLAAGVAHEINNPIGYVMSNIKTLKEYNQIYQEAINRFLKLTSQVSEDVDPSLQELMVWLQQQDIEYIQADVSELMSDTVEGTLRIREIVAGLKDFSHVKLQQEMQEEDLNEAIKKTLKVAQNELKYKAAVKVKLGNIPKVKCRIGQVQQVLLNLFINAGHAITDKGVIKVISGVMGKEVYIAVRDNGTGIAKSLQEKIFDPFFTTKEVGTGSGLGLSITYGIMQDHNGRVELDSAVGKGSTFTLFFPID
ncbi:ATP-binding protein [Marinomonas posidonica]|uniref:histidine kinase n=1 Tax=Marinomonas posidonica (strain CECT 7376 / NCIMB 14433 / IVIA-Po-181) TaxID=491952 RepID=F6CYK9_MARPP|nr:ATP-binding protein [Marinomonas posidonica]AEF54618.1 integral membrane sensor signal transduction histidine kinase [Marinomonas posidonica IVIA-Po-181]